MGFGVFREHRAKRALATSVPAQSATLGSLGLSRALCPCKLGRVAVTCFPEEAETETSSLGRGSAPAPFCLQIGKREAMKRELWSQSLAPALARLLLAVWPRVSVSTALRSAPLRERQGLHRPQGPRCLEQAQHEAPGDGLTSEAREPRLTRPRRPASRRAPPAALVVTQPSTSA